MNGTFDWLAVHVRLGDLPTWLAGFGAVAALIYARRAARHAKDVLDRETDRDERRNQEDRRAQASRVVAWPDMETSGGGTPRFGALVRNGSELPVRNVVVTFLWSNGPVWTPRGEPVRLPLLTPGDLFVPWPATVHRSGGDDEYLALSLLREDYRVMIQFTDAADFSWLRSMHGSLAEIATPTSKGAR